MIMRKPLAAIVAALLTLAAVGPAARAQWNGTIQGQVKYNTSMFDLSAGAIIYKNGGIDLTIKVTGILPVANGGTGLASGTSGGIPGYTASGTLASSPALAANAFVVGGGAGATPSAVAITGLVKGNGASAPAAYGGAVCTNQFVRSLNASGAPTCNSVANADLAGSIAASKLVGTDIATVGTIGTGTWQGTKIGLAYGGTNADLSATGGSSKFLRQNSAGAAITVVQPAASDLSDGITGSGAVVLQNAPTLTSDVVFSTGSIRLKGTAGAGYIALKGQSSAPGAAPVGTDVVLYAGSSGASFSFYTATDTNVRTLAFGTLTADRTYTFPNVSGTFITSGDTGTVSNAMLAGSIAAAKLIGTDIATVGALTAGSINWAGDIATSGALTASKAIISGNLSAAAWGSAGLGLQVPVNTYTDTTSSGTVATNYPYHVGPPTLAASSATTYTDAATLQIGNAPTAGSNVTITNPWAFLITTGQAKFGGAVNLAAKVMIGATLPSSMTGNAGELGFTKIAASGTAPGAGIGKLAVVAGTNANTCKLIMYAGTSTTPVTIVDNVGTGC